MKTAHQTPVNRTNPLSTHSHKILEQFTDPLDCLTAYLMLECSEVLAGEKPANLISIVNRTRPCGRNLYQLWQRYHLELADRIPDLCFTVLKTTPQALLLFCCNPGHLEQQLSHTGVRTLLNKAGYDSRASCQELVAELSHRINSNGFFPHEIGLFIGYPAKDVAAFMGLVKLPFTCQGPWKIYGDPARSLALAERHRCCRHRMGAILATGDQRSLKMDSINHPFFCQANENEHQYHGRAGIWI